MESSWLILSMELISVDMLPVSFMACSLDTSLVVITFVGLTLSSNAECILGELVGVSAIDVIHYDHKMLSLYDIHYCEV